MLPNLLGHTLNVVLSGVEVFKYGKWLIEDAHKISRELLNCFKGFMTNRETIEIIPMSSKVF
jgi:hypothetical protein